MSGRELAEAMRPLRPKLRVLYMSGYADDAILHHGIQRATMRLLHKPFTPTKLVDAVREALEAD